MRDLVRDPFDRRQRRAEIVRDRREQRVLEAVGATQRLGGFLGALESEPIVANAA